MQAIEDKDTAAWTEMSVKTEPEETIKIKEEENEVAVKVEPTDTTSTKRTGETLTADSNRAAKKPKTTSSSKTGNGPTCTLRISNFIRPFTLNAVKDFVQQEGNFVENGFWMDGIKTHCYVTYPSIEIAEKMKEFVHGRVWPERSGRKLAVEYSTETASDITEKHQQQLQKQQATPRQKETKAAVDANPVKNVAKETKVLKPPVTMSELFLKTETKPVLFYLPVSEELVAERKATLDMERKSQAGVVGRPQRRRKRRGGRFRR
ncbi:Apoptotic chromatin condensation inducer in the nucleus [Aphanomyces cochlioides]|nr:Apoptotic chromatin condensation inducer in the nucleus [Aphanomyces cochlioides]